MSDLRPVLHPLEIGGVVYNVKFSLATLDAIYSRYGDMHRMLRMMGIPDAETLKKLERGETVEGANQAEMIKALCFLITELANDDLDARGQPLVTERQIMRNLTPADMGRLQGAMVDIISDGMPRPEKNA